MNALARRLAALERVTAASPVKPCDCTWPLSAGDELFVINLWVKREALEILSDEEIREERRLASLGCNCLHPPASRSVEQLLADARRLGLLA